MEYQSNKPIIKKKMINGNILILKRNLLVTAFDLYLNGIWLNRYESKRNGIKHFRNKVKELKKNKIIYKINQAII